MCHRHTILTRKINFKIFSNYIHVWLFCYEHSFWSNMSLLCYWIFHWCWLFGALQCCCSYFLPLVLLWHLTLNFSCFRVVSMHFQYNMLWPSTLYTASNTLLKLLPVISIKPSYITESIEGYSGSKGHWQFCFHRCIFWVRPRWVQA